MDRVTAQSRAGVETSSLSLFGLKVFMDAHMPVTHKEGDRYPLRPPSFAPGVMEALQVSIERYTREAMRGVQGSIPCGAIKFCKCQQEKVTLL